ncbi:MAG: hypothetical protein IPI30_10905 [Saprospiraceae bacterium]|nr:hypothetical protein [Candidatus Vicinibacter affinis]
MQASNSGVILLIQDIQLLILVTLQAYRMLKPEVLLELISNEAVSGYVFVVVCLYRLINNSLIIQEMEMHCLVSLALLSNEFCYST